MTENSHNLPSLVTSDPSALHTATTPLPEHIRPYAVDFIWNNELVWQLNIPTEKMPVSELLWHFDIPWLHTTGERFNLTPTQIMQNPTLYPEQYTRTMESDLLYPIDIMFNNDRWLILDGLHRLMKTVDQGKDDIMVRKIPHETIPLITIT